MLDHRRMRDPGVCPSLVFGHLWVGHGEPSNVRLVNDGVVPGSLRQCVCSPLECILDRHGLRNVGSAVPLVAPVRITCVVIEGSGVEDELSLDGARVGIDQQFRRVPSLASLGIPGTVNPESVPRAVADTRDASMEDVMQAIGKFDAMFPGVVEHAELDAIGAFGPQRDVRAAIGTDANAEGVPAPRVEGGNVQSSAFPTGQHERTVSG